MIIIFSPCWAKFTNLHLLDNLWRGLTINGCWHAGMRDFKVKFRLRPFFRGTEQEEAVQGIWAEIDLFEVAVDINKDLASTALVSPQRLPHPKPIPIYVSYTSHLVWALKPYILLRAFQSTAGIFPVETNTAQDRKAKYRLCTSEVWNKPHQHSTAFIHDFCSMSAQGLQDTVPELDNEWIIDAEQVYFKNSP